MSPTQSRVPNFKMKFWRVAILQGVETFIFYWFLTGRYNSPVPLPCLLYVNLYWNVHTPHNFYKITSFPLRTSSTFGLFTVLQVTTSVEDCVVSYFLNVLDTSRILALLFACYTRTFIDDIKHAIYILLEDKLTILLYIFKPIPIAPSLRFVKLINKRNLSNNLRITATTVANNTEFTEV